MFPMTHFGMEHYGVDNLHLLYLNWFKHLFSGTIHEGLPESKKKIIAEYLVAAGFFSYNALSEDLDPCKQSGSAGK